MRVAGRLGDVLKRFVHFDFPLTHEAMVFATLWPGADSEGTTRELGVEFRPSRETFEDTLRWLVAAGHVSRDLAGRAVK